MPHMRRRIFGLWLASVALPTHAPPAPQPDPKPKQTYESHLAALAPKLDQLHSWLIQAEAKPDSLIALPVANPKEKPRTFPAKLLAAQAAMQLRRSLTSPPAGCTLADFPLAVAVETDFARAAWLNGQHELALKTLQDAVKSDGPNEAAAWLATFQLRHWQAQYAPQPSAQAVADPLPKWLGFPLDWDRCQPILPAPASAHQDIKTPPAWTPAQLVASADALIPGTQGEAQVRAALSAGDAFGLLGRWDDAQRAYGFVITQSRFLNARAATYVVGESEGAKHIVPGALAAEAQAKSAKIGRILEMARLSAEFVLYRRGHGQMLHGDYKEAVATFDQLRVVAEKRRREAQDKFVVQAAEAAKKSKQSVAVASREAERQWQAEAEKNGLAESPFEAAAKLYIGQCRLADGQSARGMADLRRFYAEKPSGLYRGEALLAMARACMDEGAFDAAKPWLMQLDEWIKQARANQKDWAFGTLLPGIAAAAEPLVKAPQQAWTGPDFWGRKHKQPIIPGQLVNEKTTVWYLDNLEERAAKNLGFCAFVKRDMKQAGAQWKRLAGLDPAMAGSDEKALADRADDCTRLLWAVKHGRLLAVAAEAGLFNANPRLRAQVWYAEFLYGTREFGRAEAQLRRILALDDQSKKRSPRAGLPDAQRDYLWVTLATVTYRRGNRAATLECFDHVFEVPSGNVTERRAVLGYMNAASGGGKAWRAKAEKWESALIASGARDGFAYQVRLNKAMRLAYCKQQDEAVKLLQWFRESDGVYYARAQRRLAHGGKLGLPGE